MQEGDILWMGAWTGGISSYNKKTNGWKTYLPDSVNMMDPLYNIVTAIAVKNKNEFWVGSIDKGLGLFNKNSKQFSFFRNDNKAIDKPGAS